MASPQVSPVLMLAGRDVKRIARWQHLYHSYTTMAQESRDCYKLFGPTLWVALNIAPCPSVRLSICRPSDLWLRFSQTKKHCRITAVAFARRDVKWFARGQHHPVSYSGIRNMSTDCRLSGYAVFCRGLHWALHHVHLYVRLSVVYPWLIFSNKTTNRLSHLCFRVSSSLFLPVSLTWCKMIRQAAPSFRQLNLYHNGSRDWCKSFGPKLGDTLGIAPRISVRLSVCRLSAPWLRFLADDSIIISLACPSVCPSHGCIVFLWYAVS